VTANPTILTAVSDVTAKAVNIRRIHRSTSSDSAVITSVTFRRNTHTQSDVENLVASTNVATLFLDANLRVERFTPKMAEIFNIKSRDHGQPIGDFTHSLDYEGLSDDAQAVLRATEAVEREATDRAGPHFTVAVRRYRARDVTAAAGVSITFVGVTARAWLRYSILCNSRTTKSGSMVKRQATQQTGRHG
jgi:hypothetical protein